MSDSQKCNIKLQGKVTIGSKGQIVIPNEIRKLLNLNPGDDLAVFTKNDMGIGLVKSDDIDQVMKYMQNEKEE